MSYSLECAESFSSSDASDADIRRAFDDDRIRGEYIILTSPDGSYIQASGEGDGPYALEYRNAGDTANFRADAELSKQQVRDAFLQFLRGEEAWRTSRQWMRVQIVDVMKHAKWWRLACLGAGMALLGAAALHYASGWATGAVLVLGGVIYLYVKRRIDEFEHRRRNGLCLKCGYDLRGTPNRCPECGAVPTEPPLRTPQQSDTDSN